MLIWNCSDGAEFEIEGNKMMAWIKQELDAQSTRTDLVWKASAMHHPMFGAHFGDYKNIHEDFLPLIRQANFDVFFNGHEHLMNYANYDYDETMANNWVDQTLHNDSDCSSNNEWFP